MPRDFSKGDFLQAALIVMDRAAAAKREKLAESENQRREDENRRQQGRHDLEMFQEESMLPYRQEAQRAGFMGDVKAHSQALFKASEDTKERDLILGDTLRLVKAGELSEEEGRGYAAMRLAGNSPIDAMKRIVEKRPIAAGQAADNSTERERAIAIYRDPSADPADKELAGIYLGKIPRARHEPTGGGSAAAAAVKPSLRGRVAALGEGTPKRAFFEEALAGLPGFNEPTAADSMAALNAAEKEKGAAPDVNKIEEAAKVQGQYLLDIAFPTGEGKAAPTAELKTLARALAVAKTKGERDRILDPYLDDDGATWNLKKLRKLFTVTSAAE